MKHWESKGSGVPGWEDDRPAGVVSTAGTVILMAFAVLALCTLVATLAGFVGAPWSIALSFALAAFEVAATGIGLAIGDVCREVLEEHQNHNRIKSTYR